ncbi:MAG: DUF2298 domain-containing protein, partial [Anaerolineales bacterium]|nr:DUF2298 domain-containing protein [Anaerolineales bacterium]
MPDVTLTPLPDALPRPAQRTLRDRGALAFDLLLVVLLWTGIFFRFNWVNWSEGANLHPDEYGLTNTLTQLSLPTTIDEWFNTRLSPLSPYEKFDAAGNRIAGGPDNAMRWGQWPIILLKAAAVFTDNTAYDEQRLLGRSLSALADTLALFLIFLIGRRLYNVRIGLLAATLSSLAVMQIQQSHFMTVDNFAVLFATAALYCVVRVAQRGDWRWYVLFGVAFAMAVASRINLAPLFGMLLAGVFIARYDEWRAAWQNNTPLWPSVRAALLLIALAGAISLLTFRVIHPMAFRAETGDTTFFTWHLNPNWTTMLAVSQAESNLEGGGPPAEQWTSRPKVLFPFLNMVLWGMGLPLGLTAWAGWAWAAWRVLRTDEWKTHLLPVLWAGGFFLFMGTRWVMSVRYFLPIYGSLALLAAWALYELWEVKRRATRETGSLRFSLLSLASLLSFAVVIFGTFAWAWGFTGIYRNPNTRVQATRWIFENIPSPFMLEVQTADGTRREPVPFDDGATLTAETASVVVVRPRFGGELRSISVFRARNRFDPLIPGVIRVRLAADPAGQQVLTEAQLRVENAVADERGSSFSAAFTAPLTLVEGQTYYLFFSAPEGGPIQISQAVISTENWDESLPFPFDGRNPFGGMYRGVEMAVRWHDDENKRQMFLTNLEQVDYIILPSQRGLWSTSRLPNNYPMTLEYYRALFDGRLGFELAAEFQSPIILGPLQISDVAGTLAWGRRPDLTPNPADPFNDNLFAAEEAFSVYDHAPVWIFRKRPEFSLEKASALLYAFDLTQVTPQGPRETSLAPTRMMLPPDLLAIQRAGGTWREMFDANSLLNTSQPLAVVVWYLALLALGALALPLTFLTFKSLPDRGYALSKTVALLTVTWLVWILGSFRLLPFTQGTIALSVAALLLASGVMVWKRGTEIRDWVKGNWRYIAAVEALALALFLFMLFIRSGNPDLWHPWKGGEKPMDFSYFNAVLKSTYFPPYDPWLAGGYLNYYYYGFVVAGILTKLLGIVPALAYNLILPMLLSLVGVNAFCVAYNLVEGGRKKEEGRREKGEGGRKKEEGRREKEEGGRREGRPAVDDRITPAVSSGNGQVEANERAAMVAAGGDYEWRLTEAQLVPQPAAGIEAQAVAAAGEPSVSTAASPDGQSAVQRQKSKIASPYLAGLAAALFSVVLGSLAQVRTFLVGFQNAADIGALERSLFGNDPLTATLNGLWRVATGQTVLPVAIDHWYWNATRIFGMLNSSSDFAEFPFFAFLYADLHAHMIVMPFVVMAMAWALAYLQGFGTPRGWFESAAFWAIGGLVIGVTRPSNTWDYPMYLALAVCAIVGAHLLNGFSLSRASVAGLVGRIGLLVGLSILFYQPFDRWVAVPLTELEFWRGSKTMVEAYLYHLGLFLFLALTFLVIEARRWLAETPATVLYKAREWATPLLLAVVAFAVTLALFWYLEIRIAVIALPLMVWAGLLLRPSQSVEKRAALFLLGTALAVTLFVDVAVLGGDRMNTFFKLYIQVWLLLSVAAGAWLAWAWAEQPRWSSGWRTGWMIMAMLLIGAAALYTVTAASAKMRDRFPAFSVDNGGCRAIPGMALPYTRGLPPEEQPRSLNGLDYMTFSAYCDHNRFLPLVYDYQAIRWLQDNVDGSPVLVEAQTFELYKMSSRYAWNTGLPNVVGWDWHQRQQRGAAPTQFISRRGAQVSVFYCLGLPPEQLGEYPVCSATLAFDPASASLLGDPSLADEWALDFIQRYDVSYIVVGPQERAYYPPEGLAKFDRLANAGLLR